MDATDRRILEELQADGSITNVELARRMELAPATTLERVRKLERGGVIRGYVALVDAAAVGQGTTAFVAVTLAVHTAAEVAAFRDAVQSLPEVLECYHIAGETDYLLKVVVPDIAGYEQLLLEHLTAMPNVGKVHTSFVLSTVKHQTRIPLGTDDG